MPPHVSPDTTPLPESQPQLADSHTSGTTRKVTLTNLPPIDSAQPLQAVRILVVGVDVARVEAVARGLRAHGAVLEVTDFQPSATRLRALRRFDPIVAVADEEEFVALGNRIVALFRRDPLLRWTSWFSTDWANVWSEDEHHAHVRHWRAPLRGFAQAERELSRAVGRGAAFRMNCDGAGPARAIRRLGRHVGVARAVFHTNDQQITVELTNGQVAGASSSTGETGIAALTALLCSHHVTAEVTFPFELRLDNLMQAVPDVLDAALKGVDAAVNSIAPPSLRASPLPIASLHAPPAMQAPPASLPQAHATPSAAQPALHPMAPATPPLHAPSPPPGDLLSSLRTWFAAHPVGDEPLLQTAGQLFKGMRVRRSWLAWGALSAVFALAGLGGYLVATTAFDDPEEAASSEPPSTPVTVPSADRDTRPPAATKKRSESTAAAKVATQAETEGTTAVRADDGATRAERTSRNAVPGDRCVNLLGVESITGSIRQASREVGSGRKALVRGSLEEAERAFCRAALITPIGDTYDNLARFYLEHVDPKEGAYWAERALAADNDDIETQLLMVDALAATGQTDAARRRMLQSLELESTESLTAQRIALRFIKLGDRVSRGGDPAQATRYYRRAVLLQDASAVGHAGLARVLKAQDQYAPALDEANRAVQLAPGVAAYYVLRGDVKRHLNDLPAAREDWQRALNLNPRHRLAQSRLSQYGG